MKKNLLNTTLYVLLAHFALILLGGPGYRLGLWGFRTGLGFVLWAVYVAPVALVLSLVVIKGHFKQATVNIVLSLLLLSIPLGFKHRVGAVPKIHDITTDLEDPPQFKWAGAIRKEGDHPVAYEGAIAKEAQPAAYPDIKTLDVPMPVADAFQKARKTVEDLKWEIINANETDGQIEATQTSFLYGFKDDVVIRIQVLQGNTILDLRSQSRVGISDLGANAARIRRFITQFKTK